MKKLAFSLIVIAVLVSTYRYVKADVFGSTLLGWWTFDTNNMVNNVTDSSASGFTGYLTSATSSVSGKVAQALVFDGSTSFVNVGTRASLNLTNNFTVSAWIKSNNLTGVHTIYGASRFNTNNGWRFGTNGTGLIMTTFSLNDYISSTITLATGNWYHVTAIMSGGNTLFYVNGVLRQTIASASASSNADDPYYIGADTSVGSGPAEMFNGTIDDVRIFNRAVSAAEVATIYYQGVTSHGGAGF